MCIVVFQWQPESDEPLNLIANRDEFFDRPTAPMHWWPGDEILAGRDLKSLGTWLGITKCGRFAALTNIRNPVLRKTNAPSRGSLASDFLSGEMNAAEYLQNIAARAELYEGFNLLCGEFTLGGSALSPNLWFLNSQERIPRSLNAGVYGLSNATLNTPWPKVERLKKSFVELKTAVGATASMTEIESLLHDGVCAKDEELPSTGVLRDWERALSAVFIRYGSYGTRASTTLCLRHSVVHLRETTHTHDDEPARSGDFEFPLQT
jgi:uncharacterized protein with NRDE domain